MAKRIHTEASAYTGWFLFVYDMAILWLSNLLLWKCPTSTTLLPLFTSGLGKRHLDLGVGSGYFPSTALGSPSCPCRELTLVDLNPTPLRTSRRRILQSAGSTTVTTVTTVVADATLPLPLPRDAEFDSISALYLLHCLAGPAERKNSVFDVARRHLAEDGVFIGATILPLRQTMSWPAYVVMALYNRAGIFSNGNDSEHVFASGLRRNFAQVDVWIVGLVMCWRASGARPWPASPASHNEPVTTLERRQT